MEDHRYYDDFVYNEWYELSIESKYLAKTRSILDKVQLEEYEPYLKSNKGAWIICHFC